MLLDDKIVVEESAGCVLIHREGMRSQALLIRVRQSGFEVPKGHIEPGETGEEAALRELHEETGLVSSVKVTATLDVLEYSFEQSDTEIRKRVTYFAAMSSEDLLEFGKKPAKTRELRWVSLQDLDALPLVNESLRGIIREALTSAP